MAGLNIRRRFAKVDTRKDLAEFIKANFVSQFGKALRSRRDCDQPADSVSPLS
jgi:hypothetical protein